MLLGKKNNPYPGILARHGNTGEICNMTEIAVSAGIKVNTVTFGIFQPVPVPVPWYSLKFAMPSGHPFLTSATSPSYASLRLLWVTWPQLGPRSSSLANGEESLLVPKHRRHLGYDPTTAVGVVKILVGCSHACRSLLHMDSWSRLIIPGVILMISHAATEE